MASISVLILTILIIICSLAAILINIVSDRVADIWSSFISISLISGAQVLVVTMLRLVHSSGPGSRSRTVPVVMWLSLSLADIITSVCIILSHTAGHHGEAETEVRPELGFKQTNISIGSVCIYMQYLADFML